MNNIIKDKKLEYYAKLPYTIILERYDDQGTYWVAKWRITFLYNSWEHIRRSTERH